MSGVVAVAVESTSKPAKDADGTTTPPIATAAAPTCSTQHSAPPPAVHEEDNCYEVSPAPPGAEEDDEVVRAESPPLSPEPSHHSSVCAGVSFSDDHGNDDNIPAPPSSSIAVDPLSASSLGAEASEGHHPPAAFYSAKKEKRAVWRMLEFGVSSEQGTRKTMEDQHKAMLSTDLVTPRDRNAPRVAMGIPFFGVYDGHGGPQCAEFLRENLHALILSHPDVRSNPERAIQEAVLEAESMFMEKCRSERMESGSTVALAMIIDDTLVTANVGDSEIVLSRNGEAVVLTTKHTLGSNDSEVARVKAGGGRIFHSRIGHPKFNPMLVSLGVSRAIGDAGFKLEEYTDGKFSGLIAEPETRTMDLEPQDEFIIIGCDGLWDVMTYQAAVDFCRDQVKEGVDTQCITEQLCQQALKLGSTDNVTALFVNLKIRPPSSSSAGGSGTGSGVGGRPASAASAQRQATTSNSSATPQSAESAST
mmetsp:Transcript_60751/g.70471  ORF Transcript_60751/g.70471 Transcript_60751/m.70471 type:complete len:476 (+) Transcript_60751:57-1484(+)